MNEEIKTKAKFYLQQYAENLADRINSLEALVKDEERCLDAVPKGTDMESAQRRKCLQDYYAKRRTTWLEKIELRKHALTEIDAIVKGI